ncbi:VWA domain-containing protein [Halomonas sp. McH1-25]|uniref:VWA domain-containing protein n=1 Tax=unclassified Halomonas TaxID=2609666 RepID=UPI001EF647D1|nr:MULTISPECIES: vWA domain-containing protein [unclassified Halomonas]MCG7602147.1 VWA domain-containing protein [Halomonas sp. McH1-25]MCP1344533.1 VWA domain-containing protein [Halomonas sp. FL8]MCP1360795.1 VWA domain-containing protein [Halomonas sp. BBD45]
MRSLIAAIVMALLAWAGQGWAQERPDVRLVVDVSGSMKQNDPNRLSGSALELLVSLMPSGASSGLWTFGSDVSNILPTSQVDEGWRRRALALKPALVDYQQYTDIEQAIRTAAQADPASGERHLILLTDGVVDVPAPRGDKQAADAASRRRLLEELAPELADRGVVIHTIAFSPGVDLSLVEQLATMSGGLATVAENPEALLRAFLDVLDRIFPVEQVPLQEGRFTIDERVDSFSALLFHDPDSPPLTLVGPAGQRYTAKDHPDTIQWQAQDRFDVITVPSPGAGEWRIEGNIGDDSRINVDSSLTLRTSEMPTTLYQGFQAPVEAWMESRGIPLTEEEAAGLDITAELRATEGDVIESVTLRREGDRYQGAFPPLEALGNARLSVTARGRGYVRQLQQAVNVLPAIEAQLDENAGRVALRSEHPRIGVDNTRIEARLLGETLEVIPVDDKRWRIDLPEVDPNVSVPVTLSARVELDGETRILTLPDLQLNADAETGLDSIGFGEGLSGQELQGQEATTPDQPTLADRVNTLLNRVANALPREAQKLWGEGSPYLQEYRLALGFWLLAAIAVAVLLIVWRRRASRRRRAMRREEPHV